MAIWLLESGGVPGIPFIAFWYVRLLHPALRLRLNSWKKGGSVSFTFISASSPKKTSSWVTTIQSDWKLSKLAVSLKDEQPLCVGYIIYNARLRVEKRISISFSDIKRALEHWISVWMCVWMNKKMCIMFLWVLQFCRPFKHFLFVGRKNVERINFIRALRHIFSALGKLNVLLKEYTDVLMRFYCKS